MTGAYSDTLGILSSSLVRVTKSRQTVALLVSFHLGKPLPEISKMSLWRVLQQMNTFASSHIVNIMLHTYVASARPNAYTENVAETSMAKRMVTSVTLCFLKVESSEC